jgi:Flp pilus assembly pilin Flp
MRLMLMTQVAARQSLWRDRGQSFAHDRSGATAVEYGLVALIAVAVVFAVGKIGGNIDTVFETIAGAFN